MQNYADNSAVNSISTLIEMICIDAQYFSLNRILLLAVGLWPYQRSTLVRLHVILFSGILMSFILFQFTIFFAKNCTLSLIVQVFCTVLLFIISWIKYNSFWINGRIIKHSLNEFKRICNELKDVHEITIIQRYGYYAKRYTVRITLLTMCSLITVIVQPIWPRILSIFLFINESWSHQELKIKTEYFVDQEKYFYLILLHANLAISISAISLIATGTLLIACLKHACGMFRITSYRIEQAMIINTMEKDSTEKEVMIYKTVIQAVDIHRKAMELCQFLISSFEIPFFFLIVFGVICLSLHLFRIFQIMSFNGDIEELVLRLLCGFVIILYMFLANNAGQEIMDHYNHVFFTAYNIQWHIAPLHVQKLILFILQRGSKAFNLNIGGLFVGSLESFATLVSTSVSYFTVIYSTQQ